MKFSAIVLSKNSQKTLEQCLNSLSWVNEVLLIDDFSSDNTLAIAKQFSNLRVYQQDLNNDFSQQRNFAVRKAQGEWLLFIDSDEYLTKELSQEIKTNISLVNKKAYFLKRQDIFLQKKLKFGETSRVKLLRLIKKDLANWVGSVHEKIDYKGEYGLLKNYLIHNHNISLTSFIKRINWYSSLVAEEKIKQNQKFSYFEFFFFPLGKFMQNYFLRLGFLDGMPGFIMSFIMSLHSLLVRVKIYDKNN